MQRKLNVGIIGCSGLHYKYHLRKAYKTARNAKVFACADLKIEHFQEKIENKFLDYREMLNNNGLEAVHIAVQPSLNFEVASVCLQEGLPVLLEKPMALNYTDAKKLCKISKQNKNFLMVGHVLRHDYKLGILKEMIEQKALGKIRLVKTVRTSLKNCRPCCGEIFNDGIHDIDVCCWLFKKYPKRVQSTSLYLQRKNFEDVSFINLSFGSNSIAQIHISNRAANRERTLFVVGDNKSAYINFTLNKMEMYDTQKARLVGKRLYAPKEVLVPKKENIYVKEIEHFAECVLDNTAPKINPLEAAKAVRIAEKAVEASKKKRWLNVTY